MNPPTDTPEAPAFVAVKRYKRKPRKKLPREDLLKPITITLTQRLIDLATAEAACDYITTAQVIRRIVLKHYKPLIKG